MNRRKTGFTLIEMLIVIAVILLLAGILLPALVSVKERMRETQCLSNMRQLGIATQVYLNDYDSFYPPGAYPLPPNRGKLFWHDLLAEPLNGYRYFLCPTVTRKDTPYYSYGCNPWIMGWGRSTHEAEIHRPTHTILIAEKTGQDWAAWPPSQQGNWWYLPLSARHRERLFFLAVDGRVSKTALVGIEDAEHIWQATSLRDEK